MFTRIPPNPLATRRRRAAVLAICLSAVAIGAGLLMATGEHRPDGSLATDRRPETALANESAGPTRNNEGAPAGFSRSQAGAVAAAASYLCTGQSLLDMDPLGAEDAVRAMAAADTADSQVAGVRNQLSGIRQGLARGTGPIVYRQAPVSVRLEAFDADRAQVAVWGVGVLSRAGVAPPQAFWSVSTFDLVWEDGDWKVWDVYVLPGPAPILDNSAAPATSEELDSVLAGFVDLVGSK